MTMSFFFFFSKAISFKYPESVSFGDSVELGEPFLRILQKPPKTVNINLACCESFRVDSQMTQGELGDGTTTGPETCDAENEACSRISRPVSGLGEVAAIAAGSSTGSRC